jgi:hypothetical protein
VLVMAVVAFVLAGLALATAMWLSVRRPPSTAIRPCVRWHANRITMTTFAAAAAAVFVLMGLKQLG